MKTTVVHVNDPAGWDTYIGRFNSKIGYASPYRNQFRIGEHGTREEVVEKYRAWVLTSQEPRAVWIRAHVQELRSKRLACWCKGVGADTLCHGDVLATLADQEP